MQKSVDNTFHYDTIDSNKKLTQIHREVEMAIYTLLGNEVEIIASNQEKTMVNVRFIEDDFVDQKSILELKADNGMKEIQEAIDRL